MICKHNIEIVSRDNGQLLVQRRIAGVVQDKYHTHDLTKPIKRNAAWIEDVRELCSQPSAGIVIEMPLMPTIEMSQAERLDGMADVVDFHRRMRRFESSEPSTLNNGRTIIELMELANELGTEG